MATITIPRSVKEKVEELARREDASVEELIVAALDKTYSILDPKERVEMHLELCDKYLKEADDLLSKEDPVQASEKGWGAASQILKALAAKEGRELSSHRELWGYVPELRKRYNDEEISILWHRANALHTNFYESWMPMDEVELAVRDVKKFVDKLKKLMER